MDGERLLNLTTESFVLYYDLAYYFIYLISKKRLHPKGYSAPAPDKPGNGFQLVKNAVCLD